MNQLAPVLPDTSSIAAPVVLLPYQQRWVADSSPLKVNEKSRRTGITWAEASDNVLIAASSAAAGGMSVYYIAYNQDMTIEYIQACAMWARVFNYAASEIEEGFWEEDEDDKHIKTFTIKFPDSGFRVVALSSRPSNLRGRQGIIVIDEAAFHEQLDELLKAALAMLIWGGKVRVISTHNGDSNLFNELLNDIRAGRRDGVIHRITFKEAVAEGLFHRVCLRTRREWSQEAEQRWMMSVYKFYGAGASEELDCIPANGGGAWLSRALIESRMSPDTPLLRLTCPKGYELKSDEIRRTDTEEWLKANLKPLLDALPSDARSFLGRDFGRSGDLSVDYPLLQQKSLVRRVPFVLELRNVPFKQQEQITWYLMDGLPNLLGAAFDARGNGAYLAEYAMQKYGASRVQQVMPTEGWYRDNMPPVKAALEDGNLEALPKDEDTLDDLRAVQVINGIPRVPDQRSKAKADGGKRHGDAAIALALAYFASREINKGPVKANSRRRRQSARMLEGY
ncbi:hypothetical protein LG003_05695 [Photorhabdus kleinii]|uniref:hypothetical protein n=1 Tax=Photorhabdus kleinii TaxID=768034 RepID=UPI0021D4EF20|nr:hypothetical protein [Photorhabdus kleinii]MCT8342380.1 hypothetical protein [Photorhabdus kleinii]